MRFDTTRLRYEKLLRAYWRNVDPFEKRPLTVKRQRRAPIIARLDAKQQAGPYSQTYRLQADTGWWRPSCPKAATRAAAR